MVYFEDLELDPAYKVSTLIEKVRVDFNVRISMSQAYRANGKVAKKVQESYTK